MAGIANLIWGLSGQPDPSRQLAAMLAGQQPQPQGAPPTGAAPPATSPPGPGGAAAVPPGAAAPGAAPVPSPGDPPPPGSPPQPMASQSTPQMNSAYQTLSNPPNIMSLYLQMQQRDQAMAGFNSGLALIAANHSPPSMRQAIMESANAGQEDAGQTVGNLMSLHTAMTQQGATQDMLAHASDWDTKLGLPPGTSRDMILAGKGPDLVAKMEPTDEQRNLQAKHDMFIKNGGSESDWQSTYLPMIMMGGIPGMSGDTRGRMQALVQWNKDPANANKPPPGYLTDDGKWKIYTQDLSDAKQQFGGVNDSLGKFVGDMSDVANNPSLDKITGSTGGILTGTVEGLVPGEVNNLKTAMGGLAAEAKDMSSRGGPKGVNQNLKTLGSSPDDFTNGSLTDYRDTVIAPRMRAALQAQANARGAAGMANGADTPGYLQHYMDPMYKAGGELDIGGAPKSLTPDLGPNGKPLPQPDAAHMQDFWTALEHRGPKFALDNLKNAGFDTSSLR